MRFVFLGTGTSSGIPAIGCECATCTSADPRDNRLRTCAAVEWTDAKGQERVVLLDCGPDLRQQALRRGMKRCDAILFTHNHVDHVFGLDEVRRFNVLQHGPIDIYAEPHTLEHLQRVYKHIFEAHRNVNDSFVATLLAHRIDESTVAGGRGIDVFGLRVTPIRLLHGKLPVLGFRIDPPAGVESSVFPLAYCTDVSGIPPESWARLEGVKTLVLDALRHRHHPTHFTVGQAVGVAHRVGAERTWFIHMTHDLKHAETDAELPEGVSLAWDGLVLE
ncbi:MAG TPA: MBL fold metallo-hydrolase [Phycisphaerales bacterium]|nr:MBL fold metallo-hydrolase [Phycisphaerales bacterium]